MEKSRIKKKKNDVWGVEGEVECFLLLNIEDYNS